MLNSFEILEQKIYDEGINLDVVDFESPRIKGLYIDGNIALSKNLQTVAEKTCVAVEELAHHELSVGNILDVTDAGNRKQEYITRLRAYNKLIGLHGIIRGYQAHCQSRYELAKFLEVPESFLRDALACYRAKYGFMVELDNYVIFFEPCLSVMENFD